MVFHLLKNLVDNQTALKNFLQATSRNKANWRWRLDNYDVPIEPTIRKRFEVEFERRADLHEELNDVLYEWFRRHRSEWPYEAQVRRNQLIGKLRQLLAEICIEALEPDLVILDEFQRFKSLLKSDEESADPASELAQSLFHAKTPEGHPVRTLLLSATPYKLYTSDAEIEHEDHYEDFLATTRFLMNEDDIPNPKAGGIDDRWEWAAPVVLDPSIKEFLRGWKDGEGDLPRPNPEVLPAYIDDLLEFDPKTLGRRPEHLVDLLTDVALGSPAILAARMLVPSGADDACRRGNALRIAESFWRLFNGPAVIALLTQLAGEEDLETREEGFYWRLVLRYCIAGNLQAVLDETWHMSWEQNAWSEQATCEETVDACSHNLCDVIQPATSRVHAHFMSVNPGGDIKTNEVRLRTIFALRFGEMQTEERLITLDAVRASFNSPFRPFVLTSTSVGQEGLDFHPWCHRLVHWDIPGNPVDLEQREGRVHRYKGHAVRRNVAALREADAFAAWRYGDDLWSIMFEMANAAARASAESDLIPYWIAPGKYRVQRFVPLLPYSKEVEAFARLKRQLAAYRVVFGQPRQEELLTLLDNSDIDTALLREWAIDLTPPTTSDLSELKGSA